MFTFGWFDDIGMEIVCVGERVRDDIAPRTLRLLLGSVALLEVSIWASLSLLLEGLNSEMIDWAISRTCFSKSGSFVRKSSIAH